MSTKGAFFRVCNFVERIMQAIVNKDTIFLLDSIRDDRSVQSPLLKISP